MGSGIRNSERGKNTPEHFNYPQVTVCNLNFLELTESLDPTARTNNDQQLGARSCSKPLTCVYSFNTHHASTWVYLFPFYRWGNLRGEVTFWGSQSLDLNPSALAPGLKHRH